MMLADPSKKYRRMYQRVDLPDRQWPNNEITKAPIWMSTDLRDGNQAIFENHSFFLLNILCLSRSMLRSKQPFRLK